MSKETIVILGAGVIGATIALNLKTGRQSNPDRQIILVDKTGPCAGASFGNAGAIVNGSSVPTAMPGIVSDVISMLFQRHAAFSIRGQYLPTLIPWLLRFLLQSTETAANTNASKLFELSKNAANKWQDLIKDTPLTKHISDAGWLKVYTSETNFLKTLQARQLMDRVGTKYSLLNRHEIQDLEPSLAKHFHYGFFQEDALNITNPGAMVNAIIDLFRTRGGDYQQFAVEKIQISNQAVMLLGPQGRLKADKIIVATGAWSKQLAKQVGDTIPLESERGYHVMLPSNTRHLLNRPVVNAESSFVLSPMETGIRMTSQVELASLSAKPDYRTIRHLLPKAQTMLPELQLGESLHAPLVWMGCRPSIPDSLPVLGYSPQSGRVIYAFGHQHLGMTLAAVTANLIGDLVNDKDTTIDLHHYRVNRF